MKLFRVSMKLDGAACWGFTMDGKNLGSLTVDDVVIVYDTVDAKEDFPRQWKVIYHYTFGFCEIATRDYARLELLGILSE